MEKIKYKIIDLNEDTHSIIVRYYTDDISEELLSSNSRLRPDGTPERTRSDVSITLPIPLPTDEDIEKIILQHFPKNGIDIFGKLKKDKSNLENFKKLKNKLNIEVEKGITEWENSLKTQEEQQIIENEISVEKFSTEEVKQILSGNTS